MPGDTTPVPGAEFRAVTVPGDPALLATVSTVSSEHASWRVFILPTLLMVVLVIVLISLAVVRRRSRSAVLSGG
ncbi:MAG: hypothetical protein ACRDYE_09510 [Acidimicrobiales bacterium]